MYSIIIMYNAVTRKRKKKEIIEKKYHTFFPPLKTFQLQYEFFPFKRKL
jgi:hypothetical protein